jgi:hypothetical protein
MQRSVGAAREEHEKLQEKLIRLRAKRRGYPVDLRVHYEISREYGCDTYRIITVDEVD